ncbi:HlyD family secretion protein/adhesin transport system membrane fusion protein [Maritalea mobilis]|uniref:Membrane fusion protein (MFP) family protein n=1 Tax=Maritalea mobilis TaxID=483324 RepID=A0A4R6VGP0_9HYPH|nr:HlyD family type I secretion periplasmic adaptor subunit [Maritalea mobilis]TDQ60456.1 HlyD family secretion protein/adhesin transport system membrane fusion protein [Maritalea mobilis]
MDTANPTLPNKVGTARQDSSFARRTDQIDRHANGLFLLVIAVGLLLFLIWSAFTSLDEVTRGGGRIISTEQNRNIQHMEGGLISDILVQEGDSVVQGDVLLRIENSFSKAELEQTRLELASQRARHVRLMAEAEGASQMVPPDDLFADQPQAVANEQQIFERRQANLKDQFLIFEDQARQQRLSLSEHKLRLENKRKEYDLLFEQVESYRGLVKSGAASRNELLSRESSLQQVVTQINDLEFRVPAIQSELDEVLRRQNELTTRARADAEKEAAEVAVTIAKLNEAITAMVDRKSRTNVVAPIDGRINRLLVSTVNGVVQPGQVLAQIVPDDLSIAVDARLSPKDRANVWPGLEAVIKISAYDYTVYGGLKGEVVEISPDALQDEKGNPYFRVRVRADGATLGDNNPIVPGMLAEVNILTGSHTVLDYLLRPVRRVQSNAFRQ